MTTPAVRSEPVLSRRAANAGHSSARRGGRRRSTALAHQPGDHERRDRLGGGKQRRQGVVGEGFGLSTVRPTADQVDHHLALDREGEPGAELPGRRRGRPRTPAHRREFLGGQRPQISRRQPLSASARVHGRREPRRRLGRAVSGSSSRPEASSTASPDADRAASVERIGRAGNHPIEKRGGEVARSAGRRCPSRRILPTGESGWLASNQASIRVRVNHPDLVRADVIDRTRPAPGGRAPPRRRHRARRDRSRVSLRRREPSSQALGGRRGRRSRNQFSVGEGLGHRLALRVEPLSASPMIGSTISRAFAARRPRT